MHFFTSRCGAILSLSTALPLFVCGAVPAVATLDARNYSSWMLDSIIANSAGSGSTGLTSQIEVGLFQEALRQSIDAAVHDPRPNDVPKTHRWEQSLQHSIAGSGLRGFANVTQDVEQPLDRLSIERSLIVEQRKSYNETTLAEIAALQQSVERQPRNANGGLWYYDNVKNLSAYRNLSYLDGMFSYAPSTTLLPTVYPNLTAAEALEQVKDQFDLLHARCLQNDTGLLVHGYDAIKAHSWANAETGASPIVWSRSLAWFTVGLGDSLHIAKENYPSICNSATFQSLLKMYHDLVHAELRALEATKHASGRHALFQVMTRPSEPGNYPESSGTALIAYTLAHGVRTGLLRDDLRRRAALASRSMLCDLVDNFVIHNANGTLSFAGTSTVASLSGDRVDYQYYVTRPTQLNSLIGTSAFVLAALNVAAIQT